MPELGRPARAPINTCSLRTFCPQALSSCWPSGEPPDTARHLRRGRDGQAELARGRGGRGGCCVLWGQGVPAHWGQWGTVWPEWSELRGRGVMEPDRAGPSGLLCAFSGVVICLVPQVCASLRGRGLTCVHAGLSRHSS